MKAKLRFRKGLRMIRKVIWALIVLAVSGVSAQDMNSWQREVWAELTAEGSESAAVLERFPFGFQVSSEDELDAVQALMLRVLEESGVTPDESDAKVYTTLAEMDEAIANGEVVEVSGIFVQDKTQPLYIRADLVEAYDAFVARLAAAGYQDVFWNTSSLRPQSQIDVMGNMGFPIPPASWGSSPNTKAEAFSVAINDAGTVYQQYIDGMNGDACQAAAVELEDEEEQPLPTAGWLISKGCITDPTFIGAYEFLLAEVEAGHIQLIDLTPFFAAGRLASGRLFLRTPYNAVFSIIINPLQDDES